LSLSRSERATLVPTSGTRNERDVRRERLDGGGAERRIDRQVGLIGRRDGELRARGRGGGDREDERERGGSGGASVALRNMGISLRRIRGDGCGSGELRAAYGRSLPSG